MKIIKKITMLTILLLIYMFMNSAVKAYNIELRASWIEDENLGDIMVYRTFTSAFNDGTANSTQKKWNRAMDTDKTVGKKYTITKGSDNYDYAYEHLNDFAKWEDREKAGLTRSFLTQYVYFYKEPTVDYVEGYNNNYGYLQYISEVGLNNGTGLKNMAEDSIDHDSIPVKYFSDVKYKKDKEGIAPESVKYNIPAQGYRMRLENNGKVYVQDNYITEKQYTDFTSELEESFLLTSKAIVTRHNAGAAPTEDLSICRTSIALLEKFPYANEKGTVNKGKGSVINLYDNKLIFPKKGETKVIVRHIYAENLKDWGTWSWLKGNQKVEDFQGTEAEPNPVLDENKNEVYRYAYEEEYFLGDKEILIKATDWSKTMTEANMVVDRAIVRTFDEPLEYNQEFDKGYFREGDIELAEVSTDTPHEWYNNEKGQIVVNKHSGARKDKDKYIYVDYIYKPTKYIVRHIYAENLKDWNTWRWLQGNQKAEYFKGTEAKPNPVLDENGNEVHRYAYEEEYDLAGHEGIVTFHTDSKKTLKDVNMIVDRAVINKTDKKLKYNQEFGKGYFREGDIELSGLSTAQPYAWDNGELGRVSIPKNGTTDMSSNTGYVYIDYIYKPVPEGRTRTYLVRHINIGENQTTLPGDLPIKTRYELDNPPGRMIPKGDITAKLLTPSNTNGESIYSNNSGYPEFQEAYVDCEGETGIVVTAKTSFNNASSGIKYLGATINKAGNEDFYSSFNNALWLRNDNIQNKDKRKFDTNGNRIRVEPRKPDEYSKYEFVFIDFYYTVSGGGKDDPNPKPIKPPELPGALRIKSSQDKYAGYTVASSAFSDKYKRVAVVPSGEKIKTGIDNAYPYMLGGIEIKKNTSETKYLEKTITITQPVTVKYKYTKYDDCGNKCEMGAVECIETSCPGHKVDANEPVKTSQTKEYKYKIPYSYTYYTIDTLKVFTIDKAEVIDKKSKDSAARGLPLIDGTTKILKPNDSYGKRVAKELFNANTGSIYIDEITNKKELKALEIESGGSSELNNIAAENTARDHGIEAAKNKLDVITSEEAAKYIVADNKVIFTASNEGCKIGDDVIVPVNEKTVDVKLSDYIVEEKINDGNATYSLNKPPVVEIVCHYPDKIESFYEPTKIKKTTLEHFEDNEFKVPETRTNGERVMEAKVYYSIKDYKTTGSLKNSIEDTEFLKKYKGKTDKDKDTKTLDFTYTGWFNPRTKEYKLDTEVDTVNVFTPIAFNAKVTNGGGEIFNQTGEALGDDIIQKGSNFKITISPDKQSFYSINTNRYIKQYYIKFDFDVESVEVNDTIYGGGRIAANIWIPLSPIADEKTATISARAYRNPDITPEEAVISAEGNNYTVRCVAYNAPSVLLKDVKTNDIRGEHIDADRMNLFIGNSSSSKSNHIRYTNREDIYNDSKYVAEKNYVTKNINRIFDFRVTDLADIDWKGVFRGVNNTHTGNVYESGTKKWNFYDLSSNNIINRTKDEIGSKPVRILPVGPMKNTNTGYVKAPKLGYRFSFELKTTGKVDITKTNREVKITPSFYYISKDGKNYNPEYSKGNSGIKLFYKNARGKYTEITDTNDYFIYFTPNDGYRQMGLGSMLYNNAKLSKEKKRLGNLKGLILKNDMMALSNNNFIQTWYGEYKLPNSTIAVLVNEKGKYDINKPLRDGYIGVKFNIVAETENQFKLQYSKNVKKEDSGNISQWDYEKDSVNTSQWDYEGYLGFTTPGQDANNLQLQLENGLWKIDNETYNKIKGTVILYDIDARASEDFN